MNPRPKTFLTLLLIFLVPLLLVAGFSSWVSRSLPRPGDHDIEVALFTYNFNRLLDQHEDQLVRLSHSPPLLELIPDAQQANASDSQSFPTDLRKALATIFTPETHFASVAAFDQNKRQLFFAEKRSNESVIRTKDFLPGQLQPDERSWEATIPVRSPAYLNSLRASVKISVPLLSERGRIGVITGELNLDSLLREAAEKGKFRSVGGSAVSREVIVTDDAGNIFYHPNPAFLHQPVTSIDTSNKVTAAFRVPVLNLSIAALDNTDAMRSFARYLVGGILLSLLLAMVAAYLLARIWERRTTGIKKVTEGVAAIARGDLDHRIDALSSDAIRPISDNLNLMTAQLREQIARETEARQFQSFVRLSAMLTHDLKNAIEALSLIVSNMERHFDNEAFRADAMKSLNIATQNLRALVTRLTNPVTTLSGEYKRPVPVDLVPLLKRIIKLTAEPALSESQIQTSLPETLPAQVDGERIEKVIENLILNAVEAMSGTEGKLSVAAGTAEHGKVFFSVTDSGPGMSPLFIERYLFRPFATTKKRGVGLGLYTCREVVLANGGSIKVDSREGTGTTFRVVLPSATIETV